MKDSATTPPPRRERHKGRVPTVPGTAKYGSGYSTISSDFESARRRASGRAGIVTFLTANESRADIRLSHFGHNPEVTPLSDDEAFGYFKLEDWVTMSGATVMKGFGRYDMKFKMGADGTWRIADLKLSYAYREETSRFIDDKRLEMTPGLTR